MFRSNTSHYHLYLKFIALLLLVFVQIFPSFLEAKENKVSHLVLTSVAPYKNFVEKIAGNTVQVNVMVPAGASIHTYEPSPKEMLAASKADAWFLIGESFEAKAVKAFKNHNPLMKMVDLKENVNLISNDPSFDARHCCKHCLDLHIWLSPQQSKVQAQTIASQLIDLYPEHQEVYKKNLSDLLKELDALDKEIDSQLKPLKMRVILVSHPAYAYFCRDYSLRQLSIEVEGKDPTPLQLTSVMEEARKNHIKTIFIQPQYNNKGAKLIAKHLKAKIVTLDPYSENYFASMRQIAHEFAAQ
jgi:zinc transport system substrate-binding protein